MEGGSGVVYRVVGRTRSKADCGQQTERQPPAPRQQDTTWKKYTDSPGVGAPPLVSIFYLLKIVMKNLEFIGNYIDSRNIREMNQSVIG